MIISGIRGIVALAFLPFALMHEFAHIYMSRILRVPCEFGTDEIGFYVDFDNHASQRAVVLICLAPLLLIPAAIYTYEIYLSASAWYSLLLLYISIGFFIFSRPSLDDLVHVMRRGKRNFRQYPVSSTVSILLVVAVVPVFLPERFVPGYSVLVDSFWAYLLFAVYTEVSIPSLVWVYSLVPF